MKKLPKVLAVVALLFGGAVLAMFMLVRLIQGGGDEVDWQDGNYRVYAIDYDPQGPSLGYSFNPGILGLVNERVVAAGSDATRVVVKRIIDGDPVPEYYVVEKDLGSEPHEGKVRGPMTKAQFDAEKKDHGLPEFQWVK